MKTCLNNLYSKGNITKKQYNAAIYCFLQDIDLCGLNTVIHALIEITESKITGYYDMYCVINDKHTKERHTVFKFTKEEYMTI